jgi:hypothetical protein
MLVSSCGRFAIALGTCVVISLAVSSCSRGPEETVQTVDYYRAHPGERQTLVAQCANDPGRLGKKPACINAKQAEDLEGIGSMRTLPPMGLSKGSSAASGAVPAPTPPPSR